VVGAGEAAVIRQVWPCTVIECSFNAVIEPFAVQVDCAAARLVEAAKPTSMSTTNARRLTFTMSHALLQTGAFANED
jgi:hypothetical protein